MKLVIAIVHERDRTRVSDALLNAGHKFTKISSTGGFLRDGNATLLIGAEDDEVDNVLSVVRESCKTREQMVSMPPPDVMPAGSYIPSPITVTVGGAVIFVVDVETFDRV